MHLPEIHKYTIGIFMHKYNMGKLPRIFDNFFQENQEIHHYPTRNSNKLRPPKNKSNLANRFITKTGVEFWNNISTKIPINTTISTFKRHLKDYLMREYGD
jgi:hypothetical protein